MGANKPNVERSSFKMDHRNKPVIISSYIKYISVVSNKICGIERLLQIIKIFPISTASLLIPPV